MKDLELKKFLNDNSWELNKKIVEEMMEKELEKEPENINSEFIDVCMNYLTGYSTEETSNQKGKVIKKKQNKRIKFSRLIIAAVIVILSVSTALTAYANSNNMQISDVFVSIFENKAVIKYSEKDLLEHYSNNLNGNPLYNELEATGIKNIMLPFDLYNMEYNIISNESIANEKNLIIHFENNIEVKLTEYKEKYNIQNLEISGTFTSCRKIIINKTDIYLFERQDTDSVETLISYQIKETQYLIIINKDIISAEEFVSKNRF